MKTTTKNIFVNLTVKDLKASIKFFTDLGFTFNPQFTDNNATCMIMGEHIFMMLVDSNFFRKFVPPGSPVWLKDVSGNECITCLSAESKEDVNVLVNKALSIGATENSVPEMQVGETMYGRSFNDLDGHIWEIMWMDPRIINK